MNMIYVCEACTLIIMLLLNGNIFISIQQYDETVSNIYLSVIL